MSGRNGKGIPIFCATGNDVATKSLPSVGYPANLAETIAVGASTNQDVRSYYSDYGLGIDFVAPSSGGTRRIETTDIQGKDGYNKKLGSSGDYCEAEDNSGFGGTSSATPLAAGVAALMLSVKPSLTATEVRQILRETAVKIDPVNGQYDANGWSEQYGYGRIDAARALKALKPNGDAFAATSTPAQDIPDRSQAGVRDVIRFTEVASISSIEVDVDITHTYRGDLRVTLYAPSGQAIVLHNRQGSRADNLQTTFDFTSIPALRELRGQSLTGEWVLHVQDLAAADYGRLNEWGLRIKGKVGDGDVILLEESPGVDIPDNNLAGIERVLTTESSGSVQEVEVSIDLTHTYIADLVVSLISPQHTKVDLHHRSGGAADNLIKTYTLQTTPELQQFVGESIQGPWRLKVADLAGLDRGKLNYWSLQLKLNG